MAIFGPKPRVNIWKKVNFSTFSTSCFYSIEKRFFVLEYNNRNFPGLYCLKRKSWKNGHFWTKAMGKQLEKGQFFDFLDFLFLWPWKKFFRSRIAKKDVFLAYIAYTKKLEKMAIFGPKRGVNPFRKMSIFGLFGLHVFIA